MKFKYITPEETTFLILLDAISTYKDANEKHCQELLYKMEREGRLSKIAAKVGRTIIAAAFGKKANLNKVGIAASFIGRSNALRETLKKQKNRLV